MSNYMEYGDKVAFHPGYYIKELVDESGLSQEDFAKRLDTTPKNLSLLIRGEQSLSKDIAMKLSRMIGTSVGYWLNLQSMYDSMIIEFNSEEEIKREREIFTHLDYNYFKNFYNLPHLPRKVNQQIEEIRKLLNVSSLTVFKKKDMTVNFRSADTELTASNVIKANIMVQLAINEALKTDIPNYNKELFIDATSYALTLTTKHSTFYPLLKEAFMEAGVLLVILPNIPGSKINGATKKIGKSILLMLSDRRLYSDTFWFTLFHEVSHIVNGDYGISFDLKTEKEEKADKFAEDILIPNEKYQEFVHESNFGIKDIKKFANAINRDPAIIIGRLQKDGIVAYHDVSLNDLKRKYKIHKA